MKLNNKSIEFIEKLMAKFKTKHVFKCVKCKDWFDGWSTQKHCTSCSMYRINKQTPELFFKRKYGG